MYYVSSVEFNTCVKYMCARPCIAVFVSRAGEATEAPSPAVSVGPYFLSPGSRNITATVGQTAYLPCRVAELAEQAVSLREVREGEERRVR